MKVNRRNRKVQEPLLFPGYLLEEKVNSFQHGACIIGLIFELITAKALGADCKETNSNADLCPDLTMGETLIESKAFGCKSHRDIRCLIEIGQLANYSSLTGYETYYCFWNYAKGFTINKETRIGHLIRQSALNINFGVLIDAKIVKEMYNYIDRIEGIRFRHCKLYFYGRPIIYRDYLVVYGSFFKRLLQDTTKELNGLGVNPEEYTLTQKRRRITFTYCGIPFKTNTFKMYTLLPSIPF